LTELLYSPLLRRTVRALHLSSVIRRAAYVAATRGQGFIRVTKAGVVAKFVTPTPENWRAVDSLCSKEPLLEPLLELIGDNDVVYDVGAHHGVYSVFAAHRGARVFAFEPNPACHAPFRANVDINRLDPAITLASVALSDTSGTMMLHQGEGVGVLDAVAADTGRGSAVPVSLVRGDVYAKQQGWPAPTVLKIDVEGYESAVLDGFGDLLSHVRVVLCEIHPHLLLPNETPDTILRRITDAGLAISASGSYQDIHFTQYVLAVRQ